MVRVTLVCMDCPECTWFSKEFERRERDYASARGLLTASDGTVPTSEYQRLKAAADDSWLDLEVARRALEAHRRRHVEIA